MNGTGVFSAWLKSARKQVRLTQEQLAQRIGVDRSYIVKIETGRITLPLYETRQRIHAALGTSEDELRELGIIRAGTMHAGTAEAAAQAGDITLRAAEGIRPYDDPNDPRTRIYRVVEALPDPDDLDGLASLAEWWEAQILKRSRVVTSPNEDSLTKFYHQSPNWTEQT